MSGRKYIIIQISFFCVLFCFAPVVLTGQNKGLLFDDLAFKKNVRKQYLGPAFQDEVLPSKVSLREFCPVPQNQGNIGSCVGWAVGYGAYTISDAIRKSNRNKFDITSSAFSALYLYNQVKISGCSEGAYIDKALNFSKQRGDCSFNQFNPSDCYVKPSTLLETLRITDFQALFYGNESRETRLYTVKQKLKDNFPVVIGFETNKRFSTTYITQDNPVWQSGGQFDGGHAVVVIGYDDDKEMFEVMNSWGTSFGDNGFFWMRYNDFIAYTHYAAIITLPELKDNELIALKGSVNLSYFDDVSNRLEDIQMTNTESFIYNTLKPTWKSGEIFQLRINNKSRNEYVYSFSIDGFNKSRIHFPRREEFGNTNSNDQNESALFTSEMNNLFIPNEKTGMQLNSKKEFLCVLFSKSEITDFAFRVSDIRRYYSAGSNFKNALEKAFGNQIIFASQVAYLSNQMEFNASGNAKSIVPVVIQLNTNDD